MVKGLNSHQAKAFLLFLRTHTDSIYARLSLNVIREVCIYIGHRQLLLGLSNSSQLGLAVLRLYDLEEGSVHERTVPVKAELGCVLCLRDWRTAFLLGGHPDSSQVFQLDLLTASVLKARPLLESRAYPGTVAIDGWIYVFGGKNDSPLSSCECFAPPRSRRVLPSMARAKFGFNPCVCRDEVFLAAVDPGQSSLEVFHVKSRTFRTLQWTFAATHKGCVSFVVRDELLLVTCSRQFVHATLSGELLEVRSLALWDQNNALSSCAPLRLGDTVYWVNYVSADLVAFDLRSTQLFEPKLLER